MNSLSWAIYAADDCKPLQLAHHPTLQATLAQSKGTDHD